MQSKSSFPKLKNPTILSPMAGVTDIAFRTLAKKYGAALTCTEFVSSSGVIRGNKDTLDLLRIHPSEKPVAVQIFGGNITEVVAAGKLLEKQFDIIDFNCGCPVYKVIKNGAGSGLLKKPVFLSKLLNKLTTAVNVPVSVKIRIGVDETHINALEIAKIAQDAGVAAVTVHGRTQKQGYSGSADWDLIKKVKEKLSIPVFGNGDVFSPETFKNCLDESGVDGIMIGRFAIGNPYCFRQILDYLKKGSYKSINNASLFSDYSLLAERYNLPFMSVKQQAIYFTKGLIGGSKIRSKLVKCKNISELKVIMAIV